MKEYPENLTEFNEWFRSEEKCRKYLFRIRWPDGFSCPVCGAAKYWDSSRGSIICNPNKHNVRLTSGTLFQDTHKSLKEWFEVIWIVSSQKNGTSASSIKRALGLGSYETAWNWLHKLRRAMVRPDRDRLDGILEVDETFLGGPKPGKRGRGATNKAMIFIVAQKQDRGIGRIRLRQIENGSAVELNKAIQETIEPGAVIRTDGWTGYRMISGLGYQHEIVRAEENFGENLLPLAHRVASLLKRWLLGTHQGAVRRSQLDYYLDEYTFRFNRRKAKSPGLLFYRLICQAVQAEPILNTSLIANPKGKI